MVVQVKAWACQSLILARLQITMHVLERDIAIKYLWQAVSSFCGALVVANAV